MVKVANPIYDVVFKYLMEDKRIAKLIISALIELEVIDLEFKPQVFAKDIKEKIISVYRIDFKARIKLKDNSEQVVLIELQKAKFPADIMRFRRYLGNQYAHKDNVMVVNEPASVYALPIITIYFLGYPLDTYPDVPIIKVSRQYIDHDTKQVVGDKKEYFIESLTHDSIIVQIQAIKNKKRRTRLEQALSVFEQSKVHEVDINEENYPEEYKPIIRRLIKAFATPEIRETMEVEDDILEELERTERYIAQQKDIIEQKEKEKQKAVQIAEQARREKEEQLKQIVLNLHKSGMEIKIIAEMTGKSISEIQKIIM